MITLYFIFRWDAVQRLKKLLASDYSPDDDEKTSNAKVTDENTNGAVVINLSPSKEAVAPARGAIQ